MKFILLITAINLYMHILSNKDIHMHLHFENLPLQRKLEISKMVRQGLSENKHSISYCQHQCRFKRQMENYWCIKNCENTLKQRQQIVYKRQPERRYVIVRNNGTTSRQYYRPKVRYLKGNLQRNLVQDPIQSSTEVEEHYFVD